MAVPDSDSLVSWVRSSRSRIRTTCSGPEYAATTAGQPAISSALSAPTSR